MPNLPISQLSQSTALQGDELLVNVQGGVTKQQTVQDILNANLPLTSSGVSLTGDIVPATPQGATLGSIDKPFAELYLQSGSISIESDTPGDPSALISNVDGNLEVSVGGMLLIQPDASFIAPTASFSYLSSSFYHEGTAERLGNTIVTGSVDITGSFEADLQENYVWLGDSNNRSTPTLISELPFIPTVTGNNADDLGGTAIRTIYTRNNQIVYTSGSGVNVDFLENADSNFGSRTITQNFIDNSANYKSKIIQFRVVGKTVFTGNNSDNVSVYLSIGDQKLTETDLGLQSAPFINNKPFEIFGELIFSGSQVMSCYSLGWCDQTGDFRRKSKSDPTTPQDISGFTEGDLKIIVSGSTDITMTSYYGYIQVFN
jgi:hypothetical protein